jgi:hypothetical protein
MFNFFYHSFISGKVLFPRRSLFIGLQIINRYDIILIQEIRDSGVDAIRILLEKVNK